MYRILFATVLIINTMVFCSTNTMGKENPYIARWYGNKESAVSLRFDDSLQSHVDTVIPHLNKEGIKATFMVNPGRKRYLRNKDFWENDVPRMGHILGNHTMHHTGAKNFSEAEYEIGKTAELIWSLYPDRSKLMVFASGGGERWGGKYWRNASEEYKKLVLKYKMVDLYDGQHPAIGLNSKFNKDLLRDIIDDGIEKKKHLPFLFHNVGDKGFKDYIKDIIYGYDLTISKSQFKEFLDCINEVREKLWIAPLIQVLKYETEYKATSLKQVEKSKEKVIFRMSVSTDPNLYDQKLTIVVPEEHIHNRVKKITQGDNTISEFRVIGNSLSFNVFPVDGDISIIYEIRSN